MKSVKSNMSKEVENFDKYIIDTYNVFKSSLPLTTKLNNYDNMDAYEGKVIYYNKTENFGFFECEKTKTEL